MQEIVQFRLKCLIRPGSGPGILFLHGAGSRGSLERLQANPFFTGASPLLSQFAVLAPLCEEDTWFDCFERLKALAQHSAGLLQCDPGRLSLVGASMGGYAAWQLAMSLPETFAALAPVCGGGMCWNAARLKNIGIWAFHGAEDTCVPLAESVSMVEAVRNSGGSARLTVYPQVGHACWEKAYREDELFEFLLRQQCGRRKPDTCPFEGEAFG